MPRDSKKETVKKPRKTNSKKATDSTEENTTKNVREVKVRSQSWAEQVTEGSNDMDENQVEVELVNEESDTENVDNEYSISYNMEADEDKLFSLDNANETEKKSVSECTEEELLEVLWKRGKEKLNIALRKNVIKVVRMLKGIRLHPPRKYQSRGYKNKPYKNNRRFRNFNTRQFRKPKDHSSEFGMDR